MDRKADEIRWMTLQWVGACLLLLILSGCATGKRDPYFLKTETRANVYAAAQGPAIRRVAIMPFKAPTELIGSSVSDMFVTDMLRAGRYDLVERSQMANVLSETELAMAGLSTARAVEVARMVGADGVIIGTVDEYGTVAQRGHPYPVVGVSSRLIDCRTGKIVWSVDLAERAENKKVILSEHARSVVHRMTAALYQKWVTQRGPWRVKEEASQTAVTGALDETPTAAPVAPPPPEPPAMPQGFKVSDMGLREVCLEWSEPPDTADEYRVERAVAAGGPFQEVARVSPFKRQYRDRGTGSVPLEDGKNYHYRIVAVDDKNRESPPTEVRESMTAPPPEPPASVRVETPAARKVSLAWDTSVSEGVVKYVVERTAGEDFVKVAEVTGTRYEEGGGADSPLKDQAKYFYRVSAVNRVGAVGLPTKPVAVVTRPPPAAVEDVVAESRRVRCVPLMWNASPEEDVVRYDIYRGATRDDVKKIATVKGRAAVTFTDGDDEPGSLADAATYYYTIRAVNAVGAESVDSKVTTGVTRAVPPVVTGLKAESGRPREMPLGWGVSSDEKVAGYVIGRAEDEAPEYKEIATIEGRDIATWTDRGQARKATGLGGLGDGREYRYRVLAFNIAKARSEWSEPVAGRTKEAPSVPADPDATKGLPRIVRLAWTAGPEADIREYVVEARDADAGRWKDIGRTAEAALRETDLADGVRRVYRVKSVDGDGLESAWSDEAEGAAKPAPREPGDLTVEWSDGVARLAWVAASETDIVKYRVWKKNLLKWDLLSETAELELSLTTAEVGKKMRVAVSAVDVDGLESARSATVEIVPPVAEK